MREKEFLPYVKSRLGIDNLNEMQKKMMGSATEGRDIILLSPTGSGKTLAFSLPLLKMLKAPTGRVQAVIIAPSRELVLQIGGVIRQIAAGYKVTELYGGHKVEDEVNSLSIVPDIIVATPGRLLDHIKRRNIDLLPTRILVLDEFDKSLELGFEQDMKKIINRLVNVSRTILTSATRAETLPEFLKLTDPLEISYLSEQPSVRKRMNVFRVDSDTNDKLQSLLVLLRNVSHAEGRLKKIIIFVNHRESAERVAEFLKKNKVSACLYHGALDQQYRESSVALFNNGTCPVMVATDLASRGLDIENVEGVIHYHQPLTSETYTHRNGRTARVENTGDIYLLIGPEEDVKEYVEFDRTYHPDTEVQPDLNSGLVTLHFNAGKKEKVSKGDILGFLAKDGGLNADQIGKINVYDHYALAAVKTEDPKELVQRLNMLKVKGEKRRITIYA